MAYGQSLPKDHVPLNQNNLGAQIHGLFQNDTYKNQQMVTSVIFRYRDYMLKMCMQLRKRFGISNKLWQYVSF